MFAVVLKMIFTIPLAFMSLADILPIDIVCRGIRNKSTEGRRREFARYRDEHVIPRFSARVDGRWVQQALNQKYLDRHTSIHSSWKACELVASGLRVRQVQAWAQLRIMKCFTRDGSHRVPICRLCLLDIETSMHLISTCIGAAGVKRSWEEFWCINLPTLAVEAHAFLLGSAPVSYAPAVVDLAWRLSENCENGTLEWPSRLRPRSASLQSSSSSTSPDDMMLNAEPV